MIRFIDLGTQLYLPYPDAPRSFAFYDTIVDKFLDFGLGPVWESWEEFENEVRLTASDRSKKDSDDLIVRCKQLADDWVFTVKERTGDEGG